MSERRPVFFDVGAHDGASSVRKPAEGWTVYAFEACFKLASKLREQMEHEPHYHVIHAAASQDYRAGTFLATELGDGGCGSLNKFRGSVQHTLADELWKGKAVPAIVPEPVAIIPLGTFCEEHGIDQIDYLHIDAQGEDLRVLRGFGNSIDRVVAGQAEFACSRNVCLYQDQPTLDEGVRFLVYSGFKIESITPNDPLKWEWNVEFSRA